MGKSKKDLNPVEAYRKQQKKEGIKKHKQKKDHELLQHDPQALRDEIQQLKDRESDGTMDGLGRKRKQFLVTTLGQVEKKRKQLEKNGKSIPATASASNEPTAVPESLAMVQPDVPTMTQEELNEQNRARYTNPQNSVYYHPVLNPFGAPPPGMPPRFYVNPSELMKKDKPRPPEHHPKQRVPPPYPGTKRPPPPPKPPQGKPPPKLYHHKVQFLPKVSSSIAPAIPQGRPARLRVSVVQQRCVRPPPLPSGDPPPLKVVPVVAAEEEEEQEEVDDEFIRRVVAMRNDLRVRKQQQLEEEEESEEEEEESEEEDIDPAAAERIRALKASMTAPASSSSDSSSRPLETTADLKEEQSKEKDENRYFEQQQIRSLVPAQVQRQTAPPSSRGIRRPLLKDHRSRTSLNSLDEKAGAATDTRSSTEYDSFLAELKTLGALDQ